MCGIIGIISNKKISKRDLRSISKDAERRGLDSSGILFNSGKNFYLKRSNKSLTKLIKRFQILIKQILLLDIVD